MMTFNDLLRGGALGQAGIAYGGGGSGSTTSTSYTSQLPEYAEPFYEDLMGRAEAVSREDYQPYQQSRISDFSQDQLSAFQGTQDLYQHGAPAVDAAIGYADVGLQGAQAAQGNPDLQGGVYDQAATDQYMSPYMGAVTDHLKDEAMLDAQRQQAVRDSQAAQAGAFGGDRRFIMDSLADERLLDRMTGIEAEYTQRAFENAQQQFERDRQARLQSDMFNQQYDLAAADTMFTGGQALGQLGSTAQGLDLERIDALSQAGREQQAQEQRTLDTAYEDFINQRDYPRNTLTWLSGIMHGVPVSAESNVIQHQSGGNKLSQALGSGIAGLGLYNSFQ